MNDGGKIRAIRFNPRDTVAVATADVSPAAVVQVDGEEIHALDAIPSGHKIATAAIASGHAVMKYGQPIGRATVDIARGQHVHVHNLRSARLPGPLDTR
jgi:altronate hydrolase